MNHNAIRFMLTYGHYLLVGVDLGMMKGIMDMVGSQQITDRTTMSGTCTVTGALWTVRMADVIGVHTVRLEEAPPPPLPGTQPWPGPPMALMSGISRR